MAEIPLIRAYPSAAYPWILSNFCQVQPSLSCFCRLTSIEFINVANPLQATLFNVVKSSEIEVSRYPKNRSDVDLMDTTEEILPKAYQLILVIFKYNWSMGRQYLCKVHIEA